RMLTVDMILKRALKGRLDLMGPAMQVQKELMSIPEMEPTGDTPFAAELKTLANLKKCILMVAGAAVQKFMNHLSDEQEIIMNIADMALETFVAESLLLRVIKNESRAEASVAKITAAMARCYLNDAVDRISKSGKEAINAFAQGDEQRMLLLGLKRFTKTAPFNSKDSRRQIAAKLLEDGRYTL
ncbi:MAG: acyl-CoA dehydrogenase, partial [Bacteroidota bacterium]|nr:acyl-CoA dehydrogenase [Bacteroidota bacterium]